MLVYFEERKRHLLVLYKVRSWYLLGILVFRRWEQLTASGDMATPGEME